VTVTREELHLRRVECRGYKRSDGLFEVEGRVIDTKSYDFVRSERGHMPAGTPLHDIALRLVVTPDLEITEATAMMDATPYRVCGGASEGVGALVGVKIGSGWLNEVRKRLATCDRCTHLFELLGPMATTIFQTTTILRPPPSTNLKKIDSCYAYGASREVVQRFWPERYTGGDKAAG
jgi:Protein of unknown function (DUF2889)